MNRTVEDFLNKLFKNERSKPSSDILEGFRKIFPDTINAEWSKDGKEWEVVFYQDHVEKIVRFAANGDVKEIRTNKSLIEIPGPIRKAVSLRGEIMNAILISRSDKIYWEIIYRNHELFRFLLFLDENGHEISHHPL